MITPLQFFLFISLQLLPHNLAFTIRKSARYGVSTVRFQSEGLANAVPRHVVANLSAKPNEKDIEREVSSEKDEIDLEEMAEELLLKRLGIDQPVPSPGFDADQLPIPLFTSLVIFIGSTVLTIYGFYIGIMGFPKDGP